MAIVIMVAYVLQRLEALGDSGHCNDRKAAALIGRFQSFDTDI